jgi:hypothetical protein
VVPSGLGINNVVSTSATLTWTPVAGATSYTVQFRQSSATVWNTISNITTNSCNLTGLTAATSYTWAVKTNCSVFSSNSTFSTPTAPATVCSNPTGLSTSAIGTTSAVLNWSPVSGATSYLIRYKKPGTNTFIDAGTTSNNTFTLLGLLPGKKYTWRVKANCSNFSTNKSFYTASQLPANGENDPQADPEKTLQIFPNPIGVNETILKIILNRAVSEADLMVTDISGKVVFSQKIDEPELHLDVENLAPGIYFVNIKQEGFREITKRFIRFE